MKVRNSQLRDFLNTIKYDEELLKQMKEKFYLEKIQEAKDKKGIVQFKWDELPIEVEERIMLWKKAMDTGGIKVSIMFKGKGYMKEMIEKHHLTMKSFYHWIRQGYRNENGVAITALPKISNWRFNLVLSAMVNKECIYEAAWNGLKNAPRTARSSINSYKLITKNKTPSLEEYIKFRKKEKKIKIEEIKKKKDEKNSKYDKVKIGSLYLKQGEVFKILSETKTQYRVEVLCMRDIVGGCVRGGYIEMGINGTRWEEIEWLKNNNISKSKWLLNTRERVIGLHSEKEVEIYKRPTSVLGHDEYPYYIKPA